MSCALAAGQAAPVAAQGRTPLVPCGVQRLVGITNVRRVPLLGALHRKGCSNRSEKYESRDGNPDLHEPEPSENH
jgi:hypothetical protein